MAGRLDGTVALVTGASSGIGAATARALAEQGASVALVARRQELLEQVAAEIKKKGGRALVIVASVADQQHAKDAVERTVAELGRLDILINNAGVMLLGPVLDAPTEEWERMVALNLMGLLYITHAALPHLLKAVENSQRRVADVINISSVAGRKAWAGAGVYNLTKFGVGAFSESLRQEVTGRYVRVSLMEPGWVNTELGTHVRPEHQAESLESFHAIKEVLQAQDIADAIQYIVTRPRHVAINELLVRSTEQDL